MRIGFDVTPLTMLQTGIGTYTANLLEEVSKLHTIVPLSHDHTHWSRKMLPLRTLWMQVILPMCIGRYEVDMCHFTNNVAPIRFSRPTVITLHDMSLWLMPEHHTRRSWLAMRPLIPWAVRRADAVIAVSHSGKADIVRILGVAPEKVHVIPEAPAPYFRPIHSEAVLARVRHRYHLPERFVLHVGTIEPRKNIVRLVEAVNRLPADIGLVLAGSFGWGYEAVAAAVEEWEISDRVFLLGYVPTEDLVALYNLAEVMAYPSLYEGFGLPVVEAMACGTPVLTSARGALCETADGAAELVDPTDTACIAEGLRRLLTAPDHRADLSARGLARVKRLSWAETAARTQAVYAEAASILA